MRRISAFLNNLIKIIIAILLLAALAYVGLTAKAYYDTSKGQAGGGNQPSIAKAGYIVKAFATNNYFYTNSVKAVKVADNPERYAYTIEGWWQLSGKDFKFYKGTLTLDERYFGKIEVVKR